MKKPPLLVITSLALAAGPALGQEPSIASFTTDGKLVVNNLRPNIAATVEWAPAVSGPWSDTWDGLRDVLADFTGAMQVDVPMFYRIRVSNPDPEWLVWIPPGTFMMGSPTNEAGRYDAETQHEVTISRGFWMGQCEVTQGDYLVHRPESISAQKSFETPWSTE